MVVVAPEPPDDPHPLTDSVNDAEGPTRTWCFSDIVAEVQQDEASSWHGTQGDRTEDNQGDADSGDRDTSTPDDREARGRRQYEPISPHLEYLVPPGRFDRRYHSGSGWRRFLPGVWEPPTGWGKTVDGVDAFVWVVWWLVRVHPDKFFKATLMMFTRGGAIVLSTFLTKTIFTPAVMLGGKADSMLGLVQINLQQGIVGLAVCYLVQAEISYRIKLLTPSGGAFIPITQTEVMKYLTRLPMRIMEQYDTGQLISIATTDIEKMDAVIVAMFLIITQSVDIVLQLLVLALFSWRVLMFGSVCFVLVAISMDFYSSKFSKATADVQDAILSFLKISHEQVSLAYTIRLLSLQGFSAKQMTGLRQELQKTYRARKMVIVQSDRSVDYLQKLSILVIIAMGGYQVKNGLAPGVVIAFALGMQSALTKFIDLMKNVFVLEASGPALKRLTDIVQDRIPSFVEEESDPRQLGNVAMKGVSFAFQPVISGGEMESCLFDKASTKPTTPGVQVFKDLSFSIAAGRKVAVVGGSGSGKSLLFKLLLRVYEAQEGKVTYGDLNIDRVDITTTASGTRQDIRGFEGTLRENIVCGLGELPMGEPSDEQLFAVAKLVGLIGTMEAKQSLPQGLDTKVRFTSLPTSLQQRAMIARALLQNTPVLLLDEPFACLDDWAVMVRSMAQWTYTAPPLPGSSLPEKLPRTILLATKSVETAKACDEVLFLQNGRVMEQGPLEDLMKRKGAYYRYMRRAELVYMLDADTAAVQPAFLQELWPLSELGLDAVEELAALFLTQRFDKGDIIFNQGDAAANMYIIVEGRVQERFELQHPAQPQSTKGEMLNATLPSFQSQSSIAATRLVELASVEGADATESMLQQDEALPGEPVSEKASCDCLGLRALTPSVCLGGAEPTYAVSCVARDDCVTLEIPRATFLAWLAQRNERDGAEDSVVNQMKVALKQSNVMGYEPHLAEVPDYAITQLCRLMSFSRFEVGELVLTRAKMQPMLVIVLSGMVTVKLRPSPSSRKAGMKLDKAGLLTMTVAAGRNFGLDWMLGVEKPDADLLVSAVAGARNTHLMTLDRPTFDAWVGKDAILQRHLVAGVHRVHSCTQEATLRRLWPFTSMTALQLRQLRSQAETFVIKANEPVSATRFLQHTYYLAGGEVVMSLTDQNDVTTCKTLRSGLLNAPALMGVDASEVKVTAAIKSSSLLVKLPPLTESAELREGVAALQERCARFLTNQHLRATLAMDVFSQDLRRISQMTLDGWCALHTEAEGAVPATMISTEPMALLIVTGSVKGAMTRVQSGSSAEHAGDGDVVLNAAAVSLLERLSGMSLAQAHRPTEEHAASLFVGNASVTFAKEGCVMTAFPLDFDETAIAKLQAAIEAENRQNAALLAEALDLERQVSEMQLTLGIKKRLSISSQWRKVVILVKRRLQRGVVFDPLEEMEGMVSSWPSDKLLPYIATLKERQAFLHMSVGHRREQFKRACAQWLELGLKANDPLIDLEQGDLTDDRFESIVRGMEQRKANAESSIKTLLQQVELLWERVPTDRGRKIKLRAAAMSGSINGLKMLEAEAKELSRPMAPLVHELRADLEAIWEECDIAPADRVPQLHDDTWTLSEFIQGESLLRALRAAKAMGGKMSAEGIEKLHAEQKGALEKSLASERERSAALKAEILQLVAENTRMNESLAAVGRNKVKTEVKPTNLLDLQTALDQANIDRIEAIEECDRRIAAKDAEMAETDARCMAAERLMTEARIRAVKYGKQAVQIKQKMDKMLDLPKADVYTLWPTLRKLTRELGVDAATSRTLGIDKISLPEYPKGADGATADSASATATPTGAASSGRGGRFSFAQVEGEDGEEMATLEERKEKDASLRALQEIVKTLQDHHHLRRLLEEYELCASYMREVGNEEVHRSKILDSLVALPPSDMGAMVERMNDHAVTMEEMRNAAIERQAQLLARCEVALTAVEQPDLLDEIRTGVSGASGLDEEGLQRLEQRTIKAEAWKELVDLKTAGPSLAAEMKRAIRAVKGFKAKKAIKMEAKEKKIFLQQRRAQLEQEYGYAAGTAPKQKKSKKQKPQAEAVAAAAAAGGGTDGDPAATAVDGEPQEALASLGPSPSPRPDSEDDEGEDGGSSGQDDEDLSSSVDDEEIGED